MEKKMKGNGAKESNAVTSAKSVSNNGTRGYEYDSRFYSIEDEDI